jgi:hypothetical protein
MANKHGRVRRVLLETPEAAGMPRVAFKTLHQLSQEFQGLFFIPVDENPFDQNLVLILENNLFFCHVDILRLVLAPLF